MANGRVSFSVEAVVRGYHAYKHIWAAVYGEELPCEREAGNWVDAFAVAVMKDGTVVGHVPKKISSVCSLYLRRGGSIICRVTSTKFQVFKFSRFLFSHFGRGSRKSRKFGPHENFPLYGISDRVV